MKKIFSTRNIIGGLIAVSLLFLVISCLSCSGTINKVTDAFTNPTAREVYAREFKNNKVLFDPWEQAYIDAQQDSLTVALPYGEKGTFNPSQNLVYSYQVEMKEGEVLQAQVLKDFLSQRVFMDVFEVTGSGHRLIKSSKANENNLTYEPSESGTYKIIIQPEMAANTDFFIALKKVPLYTTFPVAGKGNAAIMSFWGMERDGGARKHEGIDIFAKKGTPVVATTDGYISFAGEKGLGGKQVWLRDGLFGASLYYAHLDSIKTSDGARVKQGDTLGYVGNTGNARFTPPHLHFGIYRQGAVDPLPFVYSTENIQQSQYQRSFKAGTLKVKSTANLRQGPSGKAPVIGLAGKNDEVLLLGQSKDWLHVKTLSGIKAYISKSLVKG